MAVSFQTNLFNTFASNAFENLRPKVNQERNNSDNTESKNAKANTQDTSTKRKRNLRKTAVADTTNCKQIKRLVPYK